MPDTKGYPRTKKGRNAYISKCIETVKKENPSKSQDAVIGQCEGMWRDHWNKTKAANANLTEEEYFANFEWDKCGECKELEKQVNRKFQIFELDIVNKTY